MKELTRIEKQKMYTLTDDFAIKIIKNNLLNLLNHLKNQMED